MSPTMSAPSAIEWVVLWMELPALALVAAVIVVAVIALRRARPEDVPKVFAAFAAAFGRRPSNPPTRTPGTGAPATRKDKA